MSAPPDLYASGQRLGRYQLIRRLAVGGMAELFLARLPGVGQGLEGFEKLVVLKRILPQHALDPELLRMFLDEARLSATLSHPHITEVYDVGTDGDAPFFPFFAMEYVLGANLRQLMQAQARQGAGPLPLEHAIGIVAAAAAGLHYAHAKRGPGGEPLHIVHRDVSPSNVLVSYDGAVKVSDFGIAKWAHQRTQTQEGALKGKFAYMSPEQCRGKPLDARSDVFALGTILYELTTGEAPFQAATDFDILNKIVGGPPAPPRAYGDRPYPPELAEIVMRALALDAEARTPSAQALQLELEAFARAERLEVSTVALGATMQALFADELEALRDAQRAGKSLGDHLAERDRRPPRSDATRTATDAFGAGEPVVVGRGRRPPATVGAGERVVVGRGKRRLGMAAAALAVLATVGVLSWRARRSDAPPNVATSAPSWRDVTAARHDVSTGAVTGNNVSVSPAPPAPAATTHVSSSVRGPDKGAPRRGARLRAPPAPSRADSTSNESRLHAWDPDSPVPP